MSDILLGIHYQSLKREQQLHKYSVSDVLSFPKCTTKCIVMTSDACKGKNIQYATDMSLFLVFE